MSFDLFFFRYKEGIRNPREVKEYLIGSENDEEDDEEEDDDSDYSDAPFDTSLTEEELNAPLAIPYLKQVTNPLKRSEELAELIERHDAGERGLDVSEIDEALIYLEWMTTGVPGVYMMALSYGGDFSDALQGITDAMPDLDAAGIGVLDPQMDCVVPPEKVGEHFAESIERSMAFYNSALKEMGIGDDAEEDDAEDDDTDEEERVYKLYILRVAEGRRPEEAEWFFRMIEGKVKDGDGEVDRENPPFDSSLEEEDVIAVLRGTGGEATDQWDSLGLHPLGNSGLFMVVMRVDEDLVKTLKAFCARLKSLAAQRIHILDPLVGHLMPEDPNDPYFNIDLEK